MDGGGHELGRRSGTLNVPGIVGFGKAAQIAMLERERDICHMQNLRDKLLSGLQAVIPDLMLNGHPVERLPNNLNVTIPGIAGDALLAGLTRIAISSGSACSSASPKPSHVLKALGLTDDLAYSSLRFGLSRYTTGDEIDIAVAHVLETVDAVKAAQKAESVRQ
jgi:cysteine desulfurase